MTLAHDILASTNAIRRAAPDFEPTIGIVLGSGWDGIAEQVQEPIDVAYHQLPAFPVLGVAGHTGSVRLGQLAGRPVALLRGRKHAYETGDAGAMKGAVRTLAALGVRTMVLTNAAGSLASRMRPGALMLITDHLNMAQRTPLHDEEGTERFVDMANAYDAELRERAMAAAAQVGIGLHQGVYAWMLGPQFETPTEVRMLQTLGAHAVGMSTVPETILARHAGLKVLGLSMITNMGCGLDAEALSHAHTLSTAAAAADVAGRLLQALLPAL